MNRFLNRYGPLIAVIGGIMFLTFGVIRSVNLITYKPTEAVVIQFVEEYDTIDDTYKQTATVEYEVDNMKYEAVLDDYTENYYVGKTVKIKYNPKDPNKIITSSFKLPILLVAFGSVCIIGGVFGQARRR
ncbi:MAG: hypothetical protein IK151_07470 [Erysipelotrichaceae bacterium]|nr:hypothetical protein [Erysipelotrichaceae bacterium]